MFASISSTVIALEIRMPFFLLPLPIPTPVQPPAFVANWNKKNSFYAVEVDQPFAFSQDFW